MKQDLFEETKKRTERYWYQDGIWEIGFGLVNATLGGLFLLIRWMDACGLPSIYLLAAQLFFVIAAFWLMSRLVRFLKERITYPRTGYVAYRRAAPVQRAKRGLIAGLISGGLAAGLAVLSAAQNTTDLSSLVVGVVFAGMMIYLGHRYDLLRLYLLAILTLLLSAGVLFFVEEQMSQSPIFFIGLGLLFLLSGGITMARYLRSTRPSGEDMDYEAPANLDEP